MLSVQLREEDNGDEELGAVGVLARVGHGEETNLVVLLGKVLIIELISIDGLAPCAITPCEVSAL